MEAVFEGDADIADRFSIEMEWIMKCKDWYNFHAFLRFVSDMVGSVAAFWIGVASFRNRQYFELKWIGVYTKCSAPYAPLDAMATKNFLLLEWMGGRMKLMNETHVVLCSLTFIW